MIKQIKIKQSDLKNIFSMMNHSGIRIPMLIADSTENFPEKKVTYGTITNTISGICGYKLEEYNDDTKDKKLIIQNNDNVDIIYINKDKVPNIIIKFNKNDKYKYIYVYKDYKLEKYIIRDNITEKDLYIAEMTYKDDNNISIRYEDIVNMQNYYYDFIDYNGSIKLEQERTKNIVIDYIEDENGCNSIKKINGEDIESIIISEDGLEKIRESKDKYIKYENYEDTFCIHEYNKKSEGDKELIKQIVINYESSTVTLCNYKKNTKTIFILPFIKEHGASKVVINRNLETDKIISKQIYYYTGSSYKLQYEYKSKSETDYKELFHSYNSSKEQHRVNEYIYKDDVLYSQNTYIYDFRENELRPENAYLISNKKIILNDKDEYIISKSDEKGNKSYNTEIKSNDIFKLLREAGLNSVAPVLQLD